MCWFKLKVALLHVSCRLSKPQPAALCYHLVVVRSNPCEWFLCFFFLSSDRKAIFFNSHNVSKPESSSDLTTVAVLLAYITEYFPRRYLPLTHLVVPLRERTLRECLSHPMTM